MSERDYSIDMKLVGTCLHVTLRDENQFGAEVSSDSVDLAPLIAAVITTLGIRTQEDSANALEPTPKVERSTSE